MDIKGHCLTITVGNTFNEMWIKEPENKKSIENILRYHAVCPADMRLEVAAQIDEDREKKIKARLERRFEDIVL